MVLSKSIDPNFLTIQTSVSCVSIKSLNMDYLKELKEKKKKAFEEHEKIGFPTLSLEDQVKLLMENDDRILNKLTPGYCIDLCAFPFILSKYITISKSEFKKALMETGYIKCLKQNSMSDGEFYELLSDGQVNLMFRERGAIVYSESYCSYDDMINGFVDKYFSKIEFE